MINGYFLHNAQQRMAFEKSLQVAAATNESGAKEQ